MSPAFNSGGGKAWRPMATPAKGRRWSSNSRPPPPPRLALMLARAARPPLSISPAQGARQATTPSHVAIDVADAAGDLAEAVLGHVRARDHADAVLDCPGHLGDEAFEGQTEAGNKGEDEAGEYEGKKQEYMKTIAVIEGDAFDSFCSWRKKTKSRQARVLPEGTYDGSIEFTCLPGVGPEGNASVTFQRL